MLLLDEDKFNEIFGNEANKGEAPPKPTMALHGNAEQRGAGVLREQDVKSLVVPTPKKLPNPFF